MNSINRGFMFCMVALCWGILSAEGETVRITGRSTEYAGDSLVFRKYANMITFGERELAACIAGDSGDFECSFELDGTRLI